MYIWSICWAFILISVGLLSWTIWVHCHFFYVKMLKEICSSRITNTPNMGVTALYAPVILWMSNGKSWAYSCHISCTCPQENNTIRCYIAWKWIQIINVKEMSLFSKYILHKPICNLWGSQFNFLLQWQQDRDTWWEAKKPLNSQRPNIKNFLHASFLLDG